LFAPEYDSVPLPDQLLKASRWRALRLSRQLILYSFQPLAGVTLPPVPAFIVRKYWVLNFAVKVCS